MAGKDRIGALYYEVILDPRGYARGASSVKSESDMLVRAVQKTTSELDRIEAEINAAIKASLSAEGEKRDLLRRYAKEMLAEKKAYLKAEQDAKDSAAAADRKRTDDSIAKEEDAQMRHHRWRKKLIENTKALEERQDRERRRRRADNRKRIASERDYTSLYLKAASDRYRMDVRNHGHFRAMVRTMTGGFRQILTAANGVSGGLSKLAGNFAQALGFPPAIQGLIRAFGQLGAQVLLVGTLIAGLGAIIWKAIGIADEWAKKQMKLTAVMQGRSALAKVLADDMRALARETGMSSNLLMEFATSLKVMGVATADIRGIAETVGALSGGDPQKMKFIQKAYTDVLAKGRLMGQEALQLANQQVPIYEALAATMGIARSEAKSMAESGKISAEAFKAAMEYQANAVGGVDAMAAGMWTVSGQWTKIKQDVDEFMKSLGEDFQPIAVGLMATLRVVIKLILMGAKHVINIAGYLLNPIGKLMKFWNWYTGNQDAVTESMEEQAEIRAAALEDAKRLGDQQLKTAGELVEKELEILLTEEKRGRLAHKRELNSLIAEGKITKAQALQVVWARGVAQREKKRRDEEEADNKREFDRRESELEKWTERQIEDEKRLKELKENAIENEEKLRADAVKLAEKQRDEEIKRIDEALNKKKNDRESADSGANTGFEAGSKEEFEFLRQIEMQARRDQLQEQWENQAAADRALANSHLTAMVANTNAMANAAKRDISNKDSLQDFGYQ